MNVGRAQSGTSAVGRSWSKGENHDVFSLLHVSFKFIVCGFLTIVYSETMPFMRILGASKASPSPHSNPDAPTRPYRPVHVLKPQQ